jgi:hypothetical protein
LSLFTDIRSAIAVNAAVAAITPRVYRGIPSQEAAVPFVAFHVIGDDPHNDFEGEDTLQNITLQVDCWARDLDTASALYRAVRVALTGCGVTLVRKAYRELYEDDTKLWRASSDWSTWSLG